jgi:5-methylcytosine-specific restriction protein A
MKSYAREKPRESSTSRGYGYKWQQARAGWLAKHPLCVQCHARGLVVEATDVDHIVPHKGDMTVFWDRSNWQSLCASCHSAKTAREDGGFGNRQGV